MSFYPATRGADDSGIAAVHAADESDAVKVRGGVGGFGWMVVTCEVRLCVPCARVRPCVPCVPCVSRVCPGSPRCLFTGIRLAAKLRNGHIRSSPACRLVVLSRPGASCRRQSRRANRVFWIEKASRGQAPRRRSLVQPSIHHHEVTAEIREHGHGLRRCQPRQFCARPQYRHLSGEVVCPI